MPANTSPSYKYPNPSPLSPTDKINGPINETFVLNCPKCASHFKSSPLLEQHLQTEHNISDYPGVNTEHFHNGESGMEIMEEDERHENGGDDGMMMSGEHDEGNEDNDYEGSQDINGQDVPYSEGQNVVSQITKPDLIL